ncbi:hypothetical protein HDU91_001700 [Kappamyces sp. JEL0680]|nr:hypothetical protein HDU91_001700 [Kappamyces sp. JEL0680]
MPLPTVTQDNTAAATTVDAPATSDSASTTRRDWPATSAPRPTEPTLLPANEHTTDQDEPSSWPSYGYIWLLLGIAFVGLPVGYASYVAYLKYTPPPLLSKLLVPAKDEELDATATTLPAAQDGSGGDFSPSEVEKAERVVRAHHLLALEQGLHAGQSVEIQMQPVYPTMASVLLERPLTPDPLEMDFGQDIVVEGRRLSQIASLLESLQSQAFVSAQQQLQSLAKTAQEKEWISFETHLEFAAAVKNNKALASMLERKNDVFQEMHSDLFRRFTLPMIIKESGRLGLFQDVIPKTETMDGLSLALTAAHIQVNFASTPGWLGGYGQHISPSLTAHSPEIAVNLANGQSGTYTLLMTDLGTTVPSNC